MSRVSIPKTDVRKRNVPPSPAWGRDQSGSLFIRCVCGLPMGLDEHTISDSGEVNPSLFHDDPACGWHVYGTLEEWTPEDKASGESWKPPAGHRDTLKLDSNGYWVPAEGGDK